MNSKRLFLTLTLLTATVQSVFADDDQNLFDAIKINDLKTVKKLIEDQKANIFDAIKINDLKTVKKLIEDQKANINGIPGLPSPLFKAIEKGNSKIAKYLIEKGAEINGVYNSKENYYFDIPLIIAAKKGQTDILTILANHEKIKVNIQDSNKQTALMLAAGEGNAKCVKVLLACKEININMQDSNRRTALMLAAGEGNLECVEALLNREEIDLNIVDRNKKTALQLAKTQKIKELIKGKIAIRPAQSSSTSSHPKRRKTIDSSVDRKKEKN